MRLLILTSIALFAHSFILNRLLLNRKNMCVSISFSKLNGFTNNHDDNESGQDFTNMNNDDPFDEEKEKFDDEIFQLYSKINRMYPRKQYMLPKPDYENMEPHDPLFIDMPFPKQAGPEFDALARHIMWKRGLTDEQRKKWHQWAIYRRIRSNDPFQFNVHDYIYQEMFRYIHKQEVEAINNGLLVLGTIWDNISLRYHRQNENEIRSVINCFYKAINEQKWDDVIQLWLPDQNAQMVLPGYYKMKGFFGQLEAMLRYVSTQAAPLGHLKTNILRIKSYGNIAIVHTLETVEIRDKVKLPPSKSLPMKKPKQVLATSVVRYSHNQWRLSSHHSVRINPDKIYSDFPYLFDNVKNNDLKSSKLKSSSVKAAVDSKRKNAGFEQANVDTNDLKARSEEFRKGLTANQLKKLESKMKKAGLLESFSGEKYSPSKTTMKAIRALHRAGRLSSDDKYELLMSMISAIAVNDISVAETSFDLLVAQNQPNYHIDKKLLSDWEPDLTNDGMDDFAEQCLMIVSGRDTKRRRLKKNKSARSRRMEEEDAYDDVMEEMGMTFELDQEDFDENSIYEEEDDDEDDDDSDDDDIRLGNRNS